MCLIKDLAWDSAFFKRKIGILTKVPSDEVLHKLIRKARKDEYLYLTCRLKLNDVSEIQILEKNGFYLTDIGVVWERQTDADFRPAISAREANIKNAPVLKKISRDLFKDGRFYNDPFFSYDEAEKLYQAWIDSSLRDKEVKTFLMGKKGFITCKKLSKKKGDIPLVGVIAGEQGKGIGTSLIYKALDWFNKTGIKTVTVRTQANNHNALKFYEKLGFRLKYVDITMGIILRLRHRRPFHQRMNIEVD